MILIKPSLRELFNETNIGFPGLRDWQDAFSDLWDKYYNNSVIGLRTPTGSGKTLMGLLICEQARRNRMTAVYLTHTWQLMDRIGKEAENLGIEYFSMGSAKGIIAEDRKKRDEQLFKFTRFRHIIISNYFAFLYTKDFPQKIDVLIIDDVDLFYDTLKNYFSVNIKNSGPTGATFKEIIESLKVRDYEILRKISDGSAHFDDGNIIFPQDYNTIQAIIDKKRKDLDKDTTFRYPYEISRSFLDYYLYFLTRDRLIIEQFIPPLNEILISGTNLKKFENINKIILLSATLASKERFLIELGIDRKKVVLIPESEFQSQGIHIKMGDKLIFPINDVSLDESNPLSNEFVELSYNYIKKIILNFKKVLILCWEIHEKQTLINLIQKDIAGITIYDFTGDNYDVINEFAQKPKNELSCLVIAHRYFGLDFPGDSCYCCVITRLPTYLSSYENIIDQFLLDHYYYQDLQARRITQSLGRINRDINDIATYFIIDPRFKEAVKNNKDFFTLLDNELKGIIEYSYEKSKYGDFDECISLSKAFLSDKSVFKAEIDDFLKKYSIIEDSSLEINKDILNKTYLLESEGWAYLYKNRYDSGVKSFEKLIGVLNSKASLPEYKKKIEWYTFIIYLIYFKQEKLAEKEFREQLKDYERKIINSEVLTWLNHMALFITDDIKIKKKDTSREKTVTAEIFKKYAENPREFLGEVASVDELKDSIKNIRVICKNLSEGQIEVPIRGFVAEAEAIIKKTVSKRAPSIYKDLKSRKKDGIGELLKVLISKNYLRKSTFKVLDNNLRELRNDILHINERIKTLADAIKKCTLIKNQLILLLKDVYFSDILRGSKDLLKQMNKIERFKYEDDSQLQSKLLKWWKTGKSEFDPKIDEYPGITSYSGVLKVRTSSEDILLNIDFIL